MHEICEDKNLTYDKLKECLDKFGDKINKKNNRGKTPLMILCYFNPKMKLIELMVESGANPKLKDENNMNCLYYLFLSNENFDIDLVEYLVENGCNISNFDKNENHILHHIIRNKVFTRNKLEIISSVKPQLINLRNNKGETPSMPFCQYYSDLEYFEIMVHYDADFSTINYDQQSCLFYLFLNDNIDSYLVDYLLYHDSFYSNDTSSNSILHQIILLGKFNLKKLKLFLEGCENEIDMKNEDNETPLMLMCKYHPKLEHIKMMIEHGANPNITDNGHTNCLYYLFLNNNVDVDIVQFFLEKGCDINYNNTFHKNTILLKLIREQKLTPAKLKILMKFSPKLINKKNMFNVSPLMEYFNVNANPSLKLIKLMISFGSKLNVHEENYLSELVYGNFNSNKTIMKYFIKSQKCDPNKFPEMLNRIFKAETSNSNKMNYIKFLIEECGLKLNKYKNCLFSLINDFKFDTRIAKYLIDKGCQKRNASGDNLLNKYIKNHGDNDFKRMKFLSDYYLKINEPTQNSPYIGIKYMNSSHNYQLFY